MIEWIDNTEELEKFITKGNNELKQKCEEICRDYAYWTQASHKRDKVIAKYNSYLSKISWDILRLIVYIMFECVCKLFVLEALSGTSVLIRNHFSPCVKNFPQAIL